MANDNSYPDEKTEVVRGMENIIKTTLTRFSLTKHTIDSCIDKDNPKTIVTHDQIVSAIIHDKNRGIRTRVGTNKKRTEVEVSVSNTGKGIPQEVYPRLFQKFSRGSEKGTGLGLFICKGIVEVHGGRIWAENITDPPGAKFSFSIPITH